MHKLFLAHGLSGKAIISNTPNYPAFPNQTDMLLDVNNLPTTIQKYEHSGSVNRGTFEFSSDGLKAFKDAVNKYPKVVADFNIGNDKICQIIIQHLSPDCYAGACNCPAFMEAMNKPITETLGMMVHLKQLYGTGTGTTVINQFKSYLTFS